MNLPLVWGIWRARSESFLSWSTCACGVVEGGSFGTGSQDASVAATPALVGSFSAWASRTTLNTTPASTRTAITAAPTTSRVRRRSAASCCLRICSTRALRSFSAVFATWVLLDEAVLGASAVYVTELGLPVRGPRPDGAGHTAGVTSGGTNDAP